MDHLASQALGGFTIYRTGVPHSDYRFGVHIIGRLRLCKDGRLRQRDGEVPLSISATNHRGPPVSLLMDDRITGLLHQEFHDYRATLYSLVSATYRHARHRDWLEHWCVMLRTHDIVLGSRNCSETFIFCMNGAIDNGAERPFIGVDCHGYACDIWAHIATDDPFIRGEIVHDAGGHYFTHCPRCSVGITIPHNQVHCREFTCGHSSQARVFDPHISAEQADHKRRNGKVVAGCCTRFFMDTLPHNERRGGVLAIHDHPY